MLGCGWHPSRLDWAADTHIQEPTPSSTRPRCERQGAVEEAESEAERRDEARDVVLLHGRLSKRGLMGKWHPRWAEQLA